MNADVLKFGCRQIATELPPGSNTVKHTFENGTEVYEPYDPLKGLDMDPNGEIYPDVRRN